MNTPFIDILPLASKLDAVKTNMVIDAMMTFSVRPLTFLGTERLSLGTVDTLKLYEGEIADHKSKLISHF